MPNRLQTIIKSLKSRDYVTATEGVSAILQAKVEQALSNERIRVAKTLVNEATGGYRVVKSSNGKNWDVVDKSGKVVEGGFFSKDAADDCCDDWNSGVNEAAEQGDDYTAECQECGKVFKSKSFDPRCPKCKGYDVEIKESTVGVKKCDVCDKPIGAGQSVCKDCRDKYNKKTVKEDFQPGDRIRTKRMGQTPGTVVKVENGNVYFELDEPEGKFGKRIWSAPLSNVVKEALSEKQFQKLAVELGNKAHATVAAKSKWQNKDFNRTFDNEVDDEYARLVKQHLKQHPEDKQLFFGEGFMDAVRSIGSIGSVLSRGGDVKSAEKLAKSGGPKAVAIALKLDWDTKKERDFAIAFAQKNGWSGRIDEDTISQHEVQRVYDEVGDIGETELLCGIRSLRVTPSGEVISYICESRKVLAEASIKDGDALLAAIKKDASLKSYVTRDAAEPVKGIPVATLQLKFGLSARDLQKIADQAEESFDGDGEGSMITVEVANGKATLVDLSEG